MKRYTIMGLRYGQQRETEICQVDENPDAIKRAAQGMQIMIGSDWHGRRRRVAQWQNVRIVENKK